MSPRACIVRSVASCAVAALVLVGCDEVNDLRSQPRINAYDESPLFPDGAAARRPVPGTVPRRPVVQPDTSLSVAEHLARLETAEARLAWLEEGQAHFTVYCTPCHGHEGSGRGMVVRRGFPRPPSFHGDRLRRVSDAHIYRVITNGLGKMPSYATQVAPLERLKIIAFVRALQRSRRVPVDVLTAAERDSLAAVTPGEVP